MITMKKILTTALICLLALSPIVSRAVGRTSAKERKAQEMRSFVDVDAADRTGGHKLSPELEESLQEDNLTRKANKKQRVIIQLRETPKAQDALMLQSLTDEISQDMLRMEINANEMRATMLRSKIEAFSGRLKKSFNALAMVSAELPLGKIRELADDPEVASVSPDRDTFASGHVEVTTGADVARALGGTISYNGSGIGVAVLDSGVDPNHSLVKASTNHPGITFQKDFTVASGTGNPADVFGHGTHVTSIINGSDLVSNGAYRGIAPGGNILNLKVLNDSGAGASSKTIAALDWCIANKTAYNIRVINMSLGAPAVDSYTVDPLCLAAKRAHDAGIVVVAAAGNDCKKST